MRHRPYKVVIKTCQPDCLMEIVENVDGNFGDLVCVMFTADPFSFALSCVVCGCSSVILTEFTS